MHLVGGDKAEQVLGGTAAAGRRVLPVPQPGLRLIRERRQPLRQTQTSQGTSWLGLGKRSGLTSRLCYGCGCGWAQL